MSKRLVILTDNFGLNYSGGAIATCRIVEQIAPNFSDIFVVGKQEGQHPIKQLVFLEYQNIWQAVRHIKSLDSGRTVFYGDFYMAYFFILAKVSFYFTYHDNWPEQATFGWRNRLNGKWYIPLYKWIIRKAKWVVTVSDFKYQFVRQLNTNSSIIRNGINCTLHKYRQKPFDGEAPLKVIMLGNIDDRKFGWAEMLFEHISRANKPLFCEIHLFGHPNDKELAKRLNNYSFVQVHEFSDQINFENYHIYLSASKIENLSIAVCEALLNYTPVICFDVGGLHEVILDNKTGILVEPGNIPQMYEALESIISQSVQFNFDEQDLSNFSWRMAAEQYLKVFGLGHPKSEQ